MRPSKNSVPGNDFVKPLMIAAGSLILGHFFGGKKEAPPASAPAPGAQTDSAGGGLLGSLGGMLNNLANSQLGGAAAGATAGSLVTGGLDSLLNQFRNAGQGPAAEVLGRHGSKSTRQRRADQCGHRPRQDRGNCPGRRHQPRGDVAASRAGSAQSYRQAHPRRKYQAGMMFWLRLSPFRGERDKTYSAAASTSRAA